MEDETFIYIKNAYLNFTKYTACKIYSLLIGDVYSRKFFTMLR